MGLFDRFRQKKDKKQSIAAEVETAPGISESESVNEPDEKEAESIISQVSPFLTGLDKECSEYSEDLEAAEQYVEQVSQAVDKRREAIECYYDWQEEILQSGQDAEPEQEQPESVDASAEVFLSPNRMTAFFYCLEPIGDGKDIEKEAIDTALAEAGVVYGILPDAAEKAAAGKDYNVIIPIARGTAPVPGEDGRIVDHFPREQSMALQEDERGSVDFKNIYDFHGVAKDDVICELFYPGEGQDGCDVTGKAVSADKGNMPEIPQGKNTVIDEEQGVLLAAADGSISFQKGKFRVEPQLQIPGDVDVSTGNIEFAGDVVVAGDVQKGFQVSAGGNIIVCGMVEGAKLYAGEDIEIRKGMNGSGEGYLDAQGEVRSRFLEQAIVRAVADVSADTIINCKITCGGSIYAKKGKGIIIGGMLAAGGSIEARRIGNLSNIKTVLKIGHSMVQEEDIQTLDSELKKAKAVLDKINANLSYFKGMSSIPENKQEIYSQLIEQNKLYKNITNDLRLKLDTMQSQTVDYSKCHVKGDYIFSTTEISLNYSKIVIKDNVTKGNVYLSDERLTIGTF